MKLRSAISAISLALPLALALPGAADAHRAWLLPSETVLSGDDAWITVDGAISNDLFYPNHHALSPEGIAVERPDGSDGAIENAATGRYRSTFDVHLTQQGTWKIGTARTGAFGRYKLNGEEKRLPRGADASRLDTLIPAGATDVRIREMQSRNEFFVTLGAPTQTVFEPQGTGLEMVPVTHPNDLVSDEDGVFRFLVDGKPAAGIKVTAVLGGSRYRDTPVQLSGTTDAAGEVHLAWPEPGMYWLEAEIEDNHTSVPGATERGLGYVATLEVLAP
ncbi:DUF4198 domain-containing protein [Novosphingobium mangrovi (ex Huang et al. 2023)]|uniref:DUF4198 domain-containing protein n=1 Tax=Novosphingobium mangrovi (ex Huang et al. 2023) TaxID=2976432 RepID=A0ABT2I0V9_9SPHN|nr:DUF4198 domain-containing protein [Novosphingobium mangrovi (ex Huang et al. 2023)]MCT2398436.1 DUF4198 domain-containing protein [Novosphingobium mangrovi (ex Huang et al. 2023)]